MIYRSCKSQEENLRQMLMANLTSLVGGTNYRRSTLKGHTRTECHKRPLREIEHEKSKQIGASLPPQKLVQNVPLSSSIAQGFRIMDDNDQASLVKLH